MDSKEGQAQAQAELWNGPGGHGWVEAQGMLDRLFAPIERLLIAEVEPVAPRHVLDVGCGTGATTVALALALGPECRCVGVDVSEAMVRAAEGRFEVAQPSADFIVADAERHAFDPGYFDAVVSRFGVTFFSDFVRAFANLRKAATPRGMLRLVVWRSAEDNPFMTTAERAARGHVEIPTRRPGEPGQFALSDPARIRDVLDRSGWNDIDVEPLDLPCEMSTDELRVWVTRLGPLGRALADTDAGLQNRVLRAVLPAFDAYTHGGEVRFDAACWIVRAHA